ncbi:hypothetical protein BU14_0414s0012 [Porphyra umbilicalis]|uniref:Uncharacterized protein n=1 Tax=Porphyra umbilicalis TaxID=2786 RepID=A0A1X6NVS7_PORUM|nr:hypothetical protein BU14_0414s0012 [Porphyra umbilicalis]|eukprot:OSX72687.1 hypothetical protein BU14_0414s0012 [Porphyra umbilicalis]
MPRRSRPSSTTASTRPPDSVVVFLLGGAVLAPQLFSRQCGVCGQQPAPPGPRGAVARRASVPAGARAERPPRGSWPGCLSSRHSLFLRRATRAALPFPVASLCGSL